MKKWLDKFKYNPISPLLEHSDKSISLFIQRDLLDKTVSVEDLWQLPEPRRILRKQKPNGSWQYPAAKKEVRSQENYNQLETYRNLRMLVEQFGFDKNHPAIQKAAKYLFSFQSQEGDFRGIYGGQYSPNYSAGIAELLIKVGYESDAHIKKVFEWLVFLRQKDGGWAIPFRTQNYGLDIISNRSRAIRPDASKPFSHMVTGVVLRAFATHPTYRKSKEAKQAGELLLSNFFKKDHYPDRAGADYWLRFSFPFWFTDLISAMDSLSLLKFSRQEPQIDKALKWFVKHQQKNGLWDLKITMGRNRDLLQLWLSLAICRIFKRFYD
jgi:hypothetical protein